jgi:hypothetical protein
MEYREIVSVTGMGGLYQLLATKSDGAIVKNLADQSTKFISARLHNVTPLESIEIYTMGDNVRLHEVLKKMKESGDQIPDTKNAGNDEIKNYFKTVYPDMDGDRVYVSDMKKMLKWFDVLKANDLLNFEDYDKEDEVAEDSVEATGEEKSTKKATAKKEDKEEAADGEGIEEKPAKKTAAKKAAKKEITEGEGTEEKPAKKTAAKKAAKKEETGEEKPAKKTAKKKAE